MKEGRKGGGGNNSSSIAEVSVKSDNKRCLGNRHGVRVLPNIENLILTLF